MASSYDYDAWDASSKAASRASRASRASKASENNSNDIHKVVTLDGVAIPLVDPQNFSEFWEAREARRRQESGGGGRVAAAEARREGDDVEQRRQGGSGGVVEGPTDGDPMPGVGNNSASPLDSHSNSPVTFYTANQRQNQGAVAMYGEGVQEVARSGARKHQRPLSAAIRRPRSAQRSRATGDNRANLSGGGGGGGRGGRGLESNRGRPQSAQPAQRRSLGRSRNRPSSARRKRRSGGGSDHSSKKGYGSRTRGGAPPMRGNEEDRARVLEDYAKSIKALRKMRPTSSTQYLKLRAAKRRAEARSFASSLALEEKRRKIEVRTQVKEANKWAIMLNSGHSYTVVDDPHAGVFGMSVKVLKPNRKSLTGGAGEGASDSSTHVMKKLSIAAFQREHDRMKVEVDRDKALRAISTGGAAAGGGRPWRRK